MMIQTKEDQTIENLTPDSGEETENQILNEREQRKNFFSFVPHINGSQFLGVSMIISALILGGTWIYTNQSKLVATPTADAKTVAELSKAVLPVKGVTLPVKWGDLGKQLVDNGVIDQQKFEALYAQRGGLDESDKQLLSGTDNGNLMITQENSGVLLNLLWALGLGNKNEILEKGPMMDKKYGGADKFASTGGWTLAVGKTMNHYSRHSMIQLTPEQQALVNRVRQNIYRPCCGNSTYFPDCNHGMAMLGLLELMASQGVSEKDMYAAALAVNSYWFPDTYVTIAQYMKLKGIPWNKVDPQAILGPEYSSGSGYNNIKNQVAPISGNSGGSCGA